MKTIKDLEKQVEKQQLQIESLLDLVTKLYEVNSSLMERRTTQAVNEKIDELEKQVEKIKKLVNV